MKTSINAKATIVFLLIFFKTSVFAQVLLLSNETELYKRPRQYSGLAARGDTLFLLSERCSEIILLNTNTYDSIGRIELNAGILENMKVQLEGLAIYKNHLLITNEQYGGVRVYDYNLTTGLISPVSVSPQGLLTNDYDKYGIEGIAVRSAKNNEENICYLLKERDLSKKNSEIRQMGILENEGQIRLELRRNITIGQPEGFRYSDICFNPANDYIYCLKTTPGSYVIDTIPVNKSTGLTIETRYLTEKKKLYDASFSESVNQFYNSGYSSNLEGLAIYKKHIYLVSDNVMDDSIRCNDSVDTKTLLLRIGLKK